ncbi:hypothetical protein HLA97_17215 [Gordonia araii NBRC 100433]|nr:hypothetical protein [Gordonia araii NBRC 100433]
MSDSDKISKTINGFAEAVDTMNTPKTLSLLCESEARQIREHEDYDPNDDSTIDPLERRPVNISNLRINGDVAHVTVTRPPGRPHEYRLFGSQSALILSASCPECSRDRKM